MKKLFKRADIIVISAILLLSLLLYLPNALNNDSLTAVIYADGEIAEEIDLSKVNEAYTFSPKSGTVIAVETGKIRFAEARCKDELCISSGWLTQKGQTAACLPEKIVITIKGADKTDMLTY